MRAAASTGWTAARRVAVLLVVVCGVLTAAVLVDALTLGVRALAGGMATALAVVLAAMLGGLRDRHAATLIALGRARDQVAWQQREIRSGTDQWTEHLDAQMDAVHRAVLDAVRRRLPGVLATGHLPDPAPGGHPVVDGLLEEALQQVARWRELMPPVPPHLLEEMLDLLGDPVPDQAAWAGYDGAVGPRPGAPTRGGDGVQGSQPYPGAPDEQA